MERNKVVLVDELDHALGEMDKMEAHINGSLHRAFSVFLFNSKGQMLIHQRALQKYHGGGLWTNACCSHPQWDEDIQKSAEQRLQFEMGIKCQLKKVFSFVYHTKVENDLIEHEYDHVLVGYSDAKPILNTDEVRDYKWMDSLELLRKIVEQPDIFTYWFRMALPRVLARL